ncbi:uncharacterized protein LOC62_01G000649 [Vanrija pseudolonga]|uniref:CCHC-type domain-containing protein n=1 Tax=Vanrija pseudolonga TaxID=143232 RepID=A0AAF0XZU0_9TREE|nr:hypothetical protein LOC62_01G000649 [Vanrija pseudolonga]
MPKLPLPRLTLFTGQHCSLCEVAKQELAVLRQTHPFDITIWDIRSPPPSASEADAHRWRRAYQYDIVPRTPSRRHLAPEAPHRLGRPTKRTGEMERSTASGGDAGAPGVEGPARPYVPTAYKPYRSLLANMADFVLDPTEHSRVFLPPREGPPRPPWRRKVGQLWFEGIIPDLKFATVAEEDEYAATQERAWAAAADPQDWEEVLNNIDESGPPEKLYTIDSYARRGPMTREEEAALQPDPAQKKQSKSNKRAAKRRIEKAAAANAAATKEAGVAKDSAAAAKDAAAEAASAKAAEAQRRQDKADRKAANKAADEQRRKEKAERKAASAKAEEQRRKDKEARRQQAEEDKKVAKRHMQCFNCSEVGHHLNHCPKPIDIDAVEANKKARSQSGGIKKGKHEQSTASQAATERNEPLGSDDDPRSLAHSTSIAGPSSGSPSNRLKIDQGESKPSGALSSLPTSGTSDTPATSTTPPVTKPARRFPTWKTAN